MTLYELNDCNILNMNIRVQFIDTSTDYDIVDSYEAYDVEDVTRLDEIDEDKYPHYVDYEILSVCPDRCPGRDTECDICIDLEIPEDDDDR